MATFDEVDLSQTKLSHFYYHWFWGLQLKKKEVANNMESLIDSLLQNPDEWSVIRVRHSLITKRSKPVQFFYWLFNVDDFALDTYKIDLIKKLHEYTPPMIGEQMESKSEVTEGVKQGTISDYPLLKRAYDYFWGTRSRSNSVLTSKSNQSSNKKTAQPLTEILVPSDKVVEQLKVLGIEKNIGEPVTLSQIKTSFYNLARYSEYKHSDKGGNDKNFIALHEAYTQLKVLFVSPDAAVSSRKMSEEERMQDIRSRMDRMEQEFKNYMDESRENNQKVDQMRLEVAQLKLLVTAEIKGLPKMPRALTHSKGLEGFEITPKMKRHLKTFGIEKNVGELCSLVEVGDKYRCKALQIPQKAYEGPLAFEELQVTFSALMDLVFSDNPAEISEQSNIFLEWVQAANSFFRNNFEVKEMVFTPTPKASCATPPASHKKERSVSQRSCNLFSDAPPLSDDEDFVTRIFRYVGGLG